MAKENGLIRSMDKLGRIVIPAEARRRYGWNPNDPIEMIFTTEGGTDYTGKRRCERLV